MQPTGMLHRMTDSGCCLVQESEQGRIEQEEGDLEAPKSSGIFSTWGNWIGQHTTNLLHTLSDLSGTCHEIRFLGLISCSHFPIFSFWTYYLDLLLTDYLSHSHFSTNFTPKKGTKNNQTLGLLAVGQLKQVYSTIYVY